jgi:ActR/RegA family two-component response regulator
MMSVKQRILVVENIDSLKKQYVTGLEFADFVVDSAANLQESLDLVEARTFHVALVDLMLDDPEEKTTMEGLEILKKLQTLGEGTQAIVISGQESPGTAAGTVTDYGAIKYIQKSDILNKGMEYLIKEVSQLAASTKLKKYGDSDNIVSVLAGANNPVVWADPLLRILKPKDGFKGLNNFLTQFCEPMAPLMPERDVSPPLTIDKESRFANGRFWSKGLGRPVELVICRAKEAAELLNRESNPVWQSDDFLEPNKCYGLKGCAFALPGDVARSEFVKTL